jgi:DNA-binding MarR family transcriptional regulator
MSQQTSTPAVTADEWRSWRAFNSMRRQLDLALERRLQQDAAISAADYSVLITLFDSPDKQLRARELGAALSWEKSRLSHQVSRMEKRGLVERRECDTDARGTWVTLTTGGSRAVLGAMRDHTAALRKHFFDALTADELAVMLTASTKIMESMGPELCEALDN